MRIGQRRFFNLLLSLLLLLNLLLNAAPPQTSQAAPTSLPPVTATTPPPPTPETRTLPPLSTSHLPALSLSMAFDQEQLLLGDKVQLTIQLENAAPDPANAVTVSLPGIEGANGFTTPGFISDAKGWQWDLPTLEGYGKASFTASFRLNTMPVGAALALIATVTAKGLDKPVQDSVGAIVADKSQGANSAAFTPGVDTSLKSPDGSVEVNFPKGAYKQGLTLSYTPARDKQDKTALHNIANFKRGLGTFFLDALDGTGQAVHKFEAPLTLRLKYTPQQISALGLNEYSLTLYWFDEASVTQLPDGQTIAGKWVAIPTQVDTVKQEAVAEVDHFTGYTLSDGSLASTNYIPSLQGFQESLYTGAVNYNYPFELPAGAGGLKPDLTLSYSSGATDGWGSYRNPKTQTSWVGKGWSLDTGSVSRQKLPMDNSNYFSLVLNGRSYDLVQAEALVANPSNARLQDWAWRSADESFVKVRYTLSPTMWQMWDKNGTRYDFTAARKWGWSWCRGGVNDYAYIETYKWDLTKITDPSGNSITYNYATLSPYYSTCAWVSGNLDIDSWPTSITWGGNANTGAPDRYTVEFISSARTNDTSVDTPTNQLNQVKKTRELDALNVKVNRSSPYNSSSWELVRQYRFTYDYSLISDSTTSYCGSPCYLVPAGWSKLTLLNIQRFGNDGVTALPATTFSYNATWDSVNHRPTGGWNRLIGMNNGQGGSVSYTYQNIEQALSAQGIDGADIRNYNRVATKTTYDRGTAVGTWSYSYGTPAMITMGKILEPWVHTPQQNPNSASLYWNKKIAPGYNQLDWFVHKEEFRGHDYVKVTDPSGTQSEHWFYQGDHSCGIPVDNQGNPVTGNAIVSNACFQQLRDREFLKGKEYRSRTLGTVASGSPVLNESLTTFTVEFYDYTVYPLSGLWRAFSYVSQTDQKTYEGQATPITKTTKYYYDTGPQGGVQYGNLTRTEEYDQSGALYRGTKTWFVTRNDSSVYIVDKPYQSYTHDGQGRVLSLKHLFYDGNNTASTGTLSRGLTTRSLTYYDVPLVADLTGYTLHGPDATITYDSYGNPVTASSYPSAGTFLWNGVSLVFNQPGNGSAAITTTTSYDNLFNAFSVQITPPSVNGVTLTQSAGYDYRMGVMTSVTDSNNNISSAEYDVFGRMVKLIKPGDSSAYPTLQAYYADWEQPFRYQILQREVAGQNSYRPTEKFYDGLGRIIQTKQESVDLSQMVVSDTVYDGLGRTIKQSQPRYVSESAGAMPPYGPFWYYTTPSSDPNVMRWTQTSYDALGRPAVVTAPDGTNSWYLYGITQDGSRWLNWQNVVDSNRHVKQQRSDEFGRLVKVYEYSGNCDNGYFACSGQYTTPWTVYSTTQYSYSVVDQLTQVTDNAGNITSVTYDTLGRKTAMTDPDMGGWSYQYDVNGNLTSQSDAKQQSTSFTYDALNRLIGKTNVGGPVSYYDPFNSANSSAWWWSSTTTIPFNDNGNNVVKSSSSNGDYSGWLTHNGYNLTSGKSLSVRFKLDNTTVNSSLKIENANGQAFGLLFSGTNILVQYNADGVNWICPATLISGAQTNTWYTARIILDDTNGFTIQVKNEANPTQQGSYTFPMTAGRSWRFAPTQQQGSTYLDDYREYNSTNPEYSLITYNYDEAGATNGKGQRTSISNESGSTSWQFDARGRTTQATYSLAGLGNRVFNWTFDSADRVTTIKYPSLSDPANANAADRETVSYGYDAAWRQTSACSWNGSACTGYYANNASYNALSQPNQFTLGNNLQQTYSYNSPMSRLSNLKVGTSGSPGSLFDRSYSYDNVGNVSSISNNVAWQTQTQNYQYDSLDRLTRAYTSGGAGGSTNVKINFQTATSATPTGYLADSGLAYGNRGNGYSYGWNVDNTANARDRDAANSPDQRYDTLNQLQRPNNPNASWEIAVPNGTYTVRVVMGDPGYWDSVYKLDVEGVHAIDFTPDSATRWVDRTVIVQVTDGKLTVTNGAGAVNNKIDFIEISSGSAGYDESYSYDTIGNITSKAGVTEAYPVGGQPRPHTPSSVGGQNYSYDANGNLLSGGNRSYVWNVDNKPVSVTTLLDGVTEVYGYDADGARVAKGRNGVTTYYVGGSWEEDSSGVRKEYILFGTSTIAVKQRDAGGVVTTSYLHGDQLGSVSLATDSSGQVASQQEFDAWGKVRLGGISQTSMNYTGQRLDGTGLLFYNARYYDPQVGKFISADKLVPNQYNPQSLGRYSYVKNNPINAIDPGGNCEPDDEECIALGMEANQKFLENGAKMGKWSLLEWNTSMLRSLLRWMERGVRFTSERVVVGFNTIEGDRWNSRDVENIVGSLNKVENYLKNVVGMTSDQLSKAISLDKGRGLVFNKVSSQTNTDCDRRSCSPTPFAAHAAGPQSRIDINDTSEYGVIHEMGHIIDYRAGRFGGVQNGEQNWSDRNWTAPRGNDQREDFANQFAAMVNPYSNEITYDNEAGRSNVSAALSVF